ncbi:UDP-glucose/GDP-mannose dehydrogenase family protein, partial [candidate division WOR-3 bacterium]|nr:UDP-glucose/GDP-mannose dehydrogenase family protein [candidate division WOR-3 bacterium]
NFTKDINYAIENSDISFVCVPTPTNEDGEIDLSYINEASKSVGKAIAKKDDYHLVVIKSTVVPNIIEHVIIPSLEYFSDKKVGEGFGVCMNPEFMTEKANTWIKKDFFTDDRIVIGEYDKKSGNILEELYKPLNIPVFRVILQTAEMIKYASNCMLVTKISYWNEIFLICNKLGIDSQEVANIVGLDPRIGRYGTATGNAFGGKCLPKDLKAFISFAKEYHKTKLLRAVDDVNEEIKKKYSIKE